MKIQIQYSHDTETCDKLEVPISNQYEYWRKNSQLNGHIRTNVL
jgi:hypothetical protein